jgi:hypothetical protein
LRDFAQAGPAPLTLLFSHARVWRFSERHWIAGNLLVWIVRRAADVLLVRHIVWINISDSPHQSHVVRAMALDCMGEFVSTNPNM